MAMAFFALLATASLMLIDLTVTSQGSGRILASVLRQSPSSFFLAPTMQLLAPLQHWK